MRERACAGIGLYLRAIWDVLATWLSDRRRAIARFEQIATRAGLDPLPHIASWRETLEGDEFVLDLPAGAPYNSAQLSSSTMEIELQDHAGDWCRRVRLGRLNQGGKVLCTLVYRDALKLLRLGHPPVATAKQTDIRKPIEIGLDEHGQPVRLDLWKRSVLIGGLPDMGKSTLMAQLVAHLALAPNARIWFVDAKKGIEASVWEHTCARVAYTAPDAHTLILELEHVMDAALEKLAASGNDQHQPTAASPAVVLVIDELAELTSASQARVRRIMSLGRAVSITVIDATQRAHNKLIDTNVRALHHVSIAFACRDANESDLLLGDGAAARGFDAGQLDTPGEFYMVGAQSQPLRCKAYKFDRDQRTAVAERCPDRRTTTPSTAPYTPPAGTPPYTPADLESIPGERGEGVRVDEPLSAPAQPVAPQQARVREVLAAQPGEIGFEALVTAVQAGGTISRTTVAKALRNGDGAWCVQGLTGWRSLDVAS